MQAEHKKLILIWSFMHQDETLACPFPDRAFEAVRLSKLCEIIVAPEDSIYETAKGFLERAGLSAKDALHVACAQWAHSNYVLTCDDRLIKQCSRLNLNFHVMNPVEYIIKVVQK